MKSATINRRLAALRSMVKLARTLGRISWKIEIGGVRSEAYRDTRGPGRAAVRELFRKLEIRKDAKGFRDRAIFRLLYDLGLRRGEVITLDLADVDLQNSTVAVLGKGKTDRTTLTLSEGFRRRQHG
jgi:integrase/recombinase XerC